MSVDQNRRHLLKLASAMGLVICSGHHSLSATPLPSFAAKMIPSSNESLFPIGMGTWITFNVGNDMQLREQRLQVVDKFFELGGQMIDSSPMYGSSEDVVGYCLSQLANKGVSDKKGIRKKLANKNKLFAATKTWTRSSDSAQQQFIDSQRLWRQQRFDLLQIHNLVAWQRHLPMLQELKQQKLIRYLGVTTSHGRRHSELIKIMKTQAIDFIQLTYNIDDREAEHDILPLAQERGIAVIANRPLQGGRLMDKFQQEPLPVWSKEIGCNNWAQFFLRFIISHPAITSAIPATSQVNHMIENMRAINKVPLPNSAQREQMVRYLAAL
jgi:diketogulonate reductase-like aldo/keto reductase